MSEIRERSVTTSDGVTLHVREAGDPEAPPLILVHGFAGSGRVWHHQLADPGLTGRFRVVVPDLRGHGASQTDLAPEQILGGDMDGNAAIWSRDLDAVRDGLDAPVIVGWSFGGAVTQSHVHAHGGIGDAAAVVFLSAPCVLGPDAPEGLVPPTSIGALVATAKGDTAAFKKRVLMRGEDDDTSSAGDLALLEEAAATCPADVRSAMLAYAYDFRPTLAALPAEVRDRMTVLVAEHDLIFAAPGMETVWGEAGVRTVPVPGEGHAMALRDPDGLREALLAATSRPVP